MKTINYTIFLIKYKTFVFFKNLFEPKKRKYIMFFLGRYPDNFKHGLKPVIESDPQLRFVFGPATFVVMFHSKQKQKQLTKLFNNVYPEYTDAYFLFEITNEKYSRYCAETINKHLYGEVIKKTNDEVLNKIQFFIDLVANARTEFLKRIQEDMEEAKINNVSDSKPTDIDMDQIDQIIDKVKEFGLESLTPEEQQIFNKIFKK